MRPFAIRAAILLAAIASSGTGLAQTAIAPQPATDAAPVAPPDPSPAAETLDFESRLAAVDARMAAVVDLRADFEQRKKTAMLKRPLISKGTLVCRGETVLWKTTSPRRTDMLVAEENVKIYYHADKLAEIYPLGSRFRDAAGGPLPRLADLKTNFDFQELDAEAMSEELDAKGSTRRIAVQLTPKSEELKKYVSSIRVLIDESVPCADRLVIRDPDGEETELRFTSVKINTGVKDSELELALAAGTKVSTPGEPKK